MNLKANTCNSRTSRKRLWIFLAVVATLIAVCINVFLVYISRYYKANSYAQSALKDVQGVTVLNEGGDAVLFVPDEIRAGFIFYPGGKVEHTAYAPLMRELAESGVLCVLPHMPGNLAVFGADAADGYRERYPQIGHWYIGGHSLGGTMAASYLKKHTDEFDGLVLCASYSTADLSQSGCRVLSVYGSNDGVMNRKNYEKGKGRLPADLVEEIIDGGCHAYFGSYGAQDGDGEPSVSNAEQIQTTVDFILHFMGLLS